MKTIFERIESDSYDLSQPISKHFLSVIAKLAFEEGREAGKQEVKENLSRVQAAVLTAIEEINAEEIAW
jgi:hypothetical protein